MTVTFDTNTDTGADLEARYVTQIFAGPQGGRKVLNSVSFLARRGQVTCLVGPSGCGKSTLLNLAAGLLAPTGGKVLWDGDAVKLGPTKHLGMAFQQPGLFPWMTVERNVTVGLQVRGMSKSQARDVADKFLDSVGLGEFKASYPSQLSGGMAQRVGIARALALHPRLLLLDEPFAAVDAFTRLKLQGELRSMLELVNPTVILVTHDVSEAITLGDRIVVMTSRPGAVKSEIDVTARDHDKSSKEYAALLARVLSDLGVGSDDGGVSR